MPATAVHYRSSPEFTETTVPAALRRDHTTADGVWARIVVLQGALTYCITEGDERYPLSPGTDGIIEPHIRHHVEIDRPVVFRIDFYR